MTHLLIISGSDYTPSLSSPWVPVQMSAQAWVKPQVDT